MRSATCTPTPATRSTPRDPCNFLLSARDTGAAGHILAIAAGLTEAGFQTRLVLQGAALKLAKLQGVICDDASSWLDEADPLNPTTRAAIGRLLAELQPYAVVCGLSSFHSNGIDEAMMLAARDQGVRCFAMQDFWGDVKLVDGAGADRYLVLDETAAGITAGITQAICHVVGSPKHARFVTYDYDAARVTFRQRYEIPRDSRVLCLFGQALHAIPGYDSVLRDVVSVLTSESPYGLLYKPHPLETADDIFSTVDLLTAYGRAPFAVVTDPVELVLSGCDVALSCFSTIGLDAAYMVRATGKGPVIVYADYPADITRYWQNASGLKILPPAHDGYVLLAKDSASLSSCLARGYLPEVGEQLRRTIKQVLPDPFTAVSTAISCLTSSLVPD
jgi:hypothetical protein